MLHRSRVAFVAMVLLFTIPATSLAAFSDYLDAQDHWAKANLEDLFKAGAVDDPPPYLRPNQAATRGLMSRYLTLGWGLEPYSGNRQFFSDVPGSHKYYAFANALFLRRLMLGTGAGAFGVDGTFLREQAATVLVRAAGLEEGALARSRSEASTIVGRYSDANKISAWAIPYVAQAYLSSLFVGDAAGTFRPLDAMTKAECATVTGRIKLLKKLLDFGDAPDLPPYFKFPSRLASNGARHAMPAQVWLGNRIDGEVDSRQVNADFFDDGFVRFSLAPAATFPVAGCRVEFEISVKDRNTALYSDSREKALYFNLLIDFSRNMQWEESEWVVRNMPVNPNAWPVGLNKARLISPAFTALADPYSCWFRMTLTWGEPVPDKWVGTGAFKHGETEDYGPEERKIPLRDALLQLTAEWSKAPQASLSSISVDLAKAGLLMKDLVSEEQADDPVDVLIAKKKAILDILYGASKKAYDLGASKQDVDRVWAGLWKPFAFVTEEEVKRYCIDLLGQVLQNSRSASAGVRAQVQTVINLFADLMLEQERGDPASLLLQKKDRMIQAIKLIIDALAAEGDTIALAEARNVLAWLLFLEGLEEPVPPGPLPPPVPPPQPPPSQPPSSPPKPGPAPPLPGLITGVHSIFQAKNGRIVMKVHIGSTVTTPVHDIEIYYDHQQSWTQGSTLTPVTPPPGWQAQSSANGVRFAGEQPLEVCKPVVIDLDSGSTSPESITIVLTDKDGKPIGRSTSQRVRDGIIILPPALPANLAAALGFPGEPGPWDIVYTPGQTPLLIANAPAGGGIQPLAGGLPPTGYAPEQGYLSEAKIGGAGQYFVVRDHTGRGYCLVHVMSLGAEACIVQAEYNPSGTQLFGLD
jgi:hypothetical protein